MFVAERKYAFGIKGAICQIWQIAPLMWSWTFDPELVQLNTDCKSFTGWALSYLMSTCSWKSGSCSLSRAPQTHGKCRDLWAARANCMQRPKIPPVMFCFALDSCTSHLNKRSLSVGLLVLSVDPKLCSYQPIDYWPTDVACISSSRCIQVKLRPVWQLYVLAS